ncbi:MAG: chloride channel protein [Candidatus Acidiferrales bacterium]
MPEATTAPPQDGGQTLQESAPTRRWVGVALRALALREGQLFLLLAVVIGLLSGLSVVCFRIAIEWVRFWTLGSSLAPSTLRVILAPTLGGLLVGFLVLRLFPRARGSGVNQTKAAVYISDGYVPFSTVIGKFICCALAIGTGQSLGPEDPSLQMGAGIASALGRRLRLSKEKVRLIAPVGAAAGLAAAFNAPISAVIFVIEEVIGTWNAGVLGAIVLAAVSSVVVMRWFLGSEPLFRAPAYRLAHPGELLSYAALGIVGGIASVLFVKFIAFARPRLKSMPRWTQYSQPAAAGLLIGIVGIKLPQVMGAGYPYIDQALHAEYVWYVLLLLGAAKILSTGVSFVSGSPGGMFAPTLFIGAMIGGAVGGAEHAAFPQLAGSVGTFGLIGMGVLFAGFLRAPITSVFMVMEVSGNYSIILPAMISNMLAYLISLRFAPEPLFDLLSRQDGIHLPSMETLRERRSLRVEDAMRPAEESVLLGEETAVKATSRLEPNSGNFLVVSMPEGTWAGVAREDLFLALRLDEHTLVRDVPGFRPLPHVHRDQPLDEALRRVGSLPFLPVVHRAKPRKLEGLLSLDDILQAYRNIGR